MKLGTGLASEKRDIRQISRREPAPSMSAPRETPTREQHKRQRWRDAAQPGESRCRVATSVTRLRRSQRILVLAWNDRVHLPAAQNRTGVVVDPQPRIRP
jgi:hypothetical protein